MDPEAVLCCPAVADEASMSAFGVDMVVAYEYDVKLGRVEVE